MIHLVFLRNWISNKNKKKTAKRTEDYEDTVWINDAKLTSCLLICASNVLILVSSSFIV